MYFDKFLSDSPDLVPTEKKPSKEPAPDFRSKVLYLPSERGHRSTKAIQKIVTLLLLHMLILISDEPLSVQQARDLMRSGQTNLISKYNSILVRLPGNKQHSLLSIIEILRLLVH